MRSPGLISPLAFVFLNSNAAAADFSRLLTETIFNKLAPDATYPYTYDGFITAAKTWNSGHPNNRVFSATTEMEQRHEIAAFFGNALHESDGFQASREYFMCENYMTVNYEVYCSLPSTQFDSAQDQYCSTDHTHPATGTREDGCNCGLEIPHSSLGRYVHADKLYFGRGALQLSWNYNYIDASKELTGSARTLCDRPELVATDPIFAFGTAMWFWAMNTGSIHTTSRDAVLTYGDFGGTVSIINNDECSSSDRKESLKQRLNYYCEASTALKVDSLLRLNGCAKLQKVFNKCVADESCPACVAWAAMKSDNSMSDAVALSGNASDRDNGGVKPQATPSRPSIHSSGLQQKHYLRLEITFDTNPDQITWRFNNDRSATTLDYRVFGYYGQELAGSSVVEYIEILGDDDIAGDPLNEDIVREYSFIIFDEGGDGLCCSSGEGSYALYSNDKLLFIGNAFGSSQKHHASVDPRDFLNARIVTNDNSVSVGRNESQALSFVSMNVPQTKKPSKSPTSSPAPTSIILSPSAQLAVDQDRWFCGYSWDWFADHCDEAIPCPTGDSSGKCGSWYFKMKLYA